MASEDYVFVSFAEEDRPTASRLMHALRQQGLRAYDYSRAAPDVYGERIAENLMKELGRSDFVVVLISGNSTSADKEYTHLEVQAVVEEGFLDRKRALGVLLSDCPPQKWVRLHDNEVRAKAARFPDAEIIHTLSRQYAGWHFVADEVWRAVRTATPTDMAALFPDARVGAWYGAFEPLREFLCATVRSGQENSFREVAQIICNRLGRDFCRPVRSDKRLPLYEKLQQEIAGLDEFARQDALEEIDNFDVNRVVGDWQSALEEIRGLIKHWPKSKPYYPLVIEGLCHLHLGAYDNAAECFDYAAQHPHADENVWGGRAKVSYLRGDLTAAYEQTQRAIALCRGNDTLATADLLNIALTVIDRQPELDASDARQTQLLADCRALIRDDVWFDGLGVQEQAMEDRIRIKQLLSERLRAVGRRGEATAMLDDLLHKAQGRLTIPNEELAEFPELSNRLLARIADVDLYFDDDATIVASAGGAARPSPRDFTVKEKDRRFRFVRRADSEAYDLFYLDAALAIARFDLLREADAVDDAVGFLERISSLIEHRDILHRLALAYCSRGEFERACDLYVNRLSREPFREPHLLIETCRLHRRVSKPSAIADYARQAVDLCETRLNARTEDRRYYNYYLGFGHFLLANCDEARVYFRKSEGFDVWYEEVW